MPKRTRHGLDNLKQVSVKKSRTTGPEPTFENAVTQSTVIDDFFAFLSADSLARLSTTNKLFNAFYKQECYQDETYWQKKLYRDFHLTVFNSHFKEQYIAEYFLQKAQTSVTNNHYYARLRAHIDNYTECDWAHYYLAILSAHEELKDFYGRKDTMHHALAAVALGELRAGQFIIDYIEASLDKNLPISPRKLDRLLEHLNKITRPNFEVKKLCCFAHSLIARFPIRAGTKKFNLKEALNILIKLLAPVDCRIDRFLKLTTNAFRLSGLISAQYAHKLLHDPRLLDCLSVFDAVTLLAKNQKLPIIVRQAFNSWLNDLRKNEHPIACYYAAEKIRQTITVKIIANPYDYINSQEADTELALAADYYKKAVAGGEYRAVGEGLDGKPGGLYKLIAIKPELPLMEKDEFLSMVKTGIVQDEDPFCMIILAKEYTKKSGWHKDPHKLWVVQVAATYADEDGQPAYDALLRLADHPNTHPYVHCALSLVYAARGNTEKSYEAFALAAQIDISLTEAYLAQGRLNGLCIDQDEVIFYQHAKTKQQEISHQPTHQYFLRRR